MIEWSVAPTDRLSELNPQVRVLGGAVKSVNNWAQLVELESFQDRIRE